MSDDTPNLSDAPRLKEYLSLLPISTPDAAEEMGVEQTTVEDYRNRLQDTHGVDLAYDRDANQWFLADDRATQLRTLSTRTKQSITREVTELIEDEKRTLMRRLRRTDPLQAAPAERDNHEQWTDVEIPLNEQIEESVSALFQLCRTLAREFCTLQIRGVPGNHGTDKPSASIGANTDLLTYSWLDDRLRDVGVDNVDLRTTETHHYLNTTVRDWRFHVRHGDDEKEHVDETAASARDWRGLVDEFDFDVSMKGHHHSPAFHKVMNAYPVFSAPSPKPGGEFPSRIGKPDTSRSADLGWVFGVSDTRPVTWQFLLDDQ